MKKEEYDLLEGFMRECMQDSAHDTEHIFRVLYTALEIAETEKNVDHDVLIAACLLHDIGRGEQFENPELCHALVGAEKAYAFLQAQGFSPEFCERVKLCIASHRFRQDRQPQSLEAKILFDADKIDVAGAVGIARTLIYKGIVGEPVYRMLPDGRVSDGMEDTEPSFFYEYRHKLEKIYSGFYTEKGKEIAESRRLAAADFYEALYREVSSPYAAGRRRLAEYMERSGVGGQEVSEGI